MSAIYAKKIGCVRMERRFLQRFTLLCKCPKNATGPFSAPLCSAQGTRPANPAQLAFQCAHELPPGGPGGLSRRAYGCRCTHQKCPLCKENRPQPVFSPLRSA